MKKTDRYVVAIHVPPFVKNYLLTNFGVVDRDWQCLVNLSADKYLSSIFRGMLVRKDFQFDKRIESQKSGFRSEKVNVEITRADFYRYGWALSRTDEVRFSIILESRCKTMLLTYLASAYMVNQNLAECIRKFYQLFGFSEDTWPIDSIRKIWLRDKTINKTELKGELQQKINEIIILQLSQNGTIAEQGKLAYENNQSTT